MKRLLLLLLLSLLFPYTSFAQSSVNPENGVLSFAGLDDTSCPTKIKDNRASDIQNISLNIDGTAKKRYGYSLKNTTLDTNDLVDNFEAVTSIYELRKSTGTNYFMVTCGSKLFYDNSGTWTNITGNAVITEGQDYQWSWITALDYAVGTNGTDPPIQWNGAGTASKVSFTGLTNSITKAKCFAWWKNYLIFGNTTEGSTAYTTRIRWSNVGTIGTWSDADYVDIATQGGQQIEGFGILYDNLIIFLTNSIYKVSLVGGDELIVVTKVSEGVGCIAKNSIQNVLINNTENLIFLSKDATIKQFDGNGIKEISILIRNLLKGVKVSRLPYAVSTNDFTNSHYYLALTNTNAATKNNLLLDFYYEVGEWSKHTNINANCLGIADDINSLPQLYFGNYSAFVYQLFNPSNIDDVVGLKGTFDNRDVYDTATASGLKVIYDNELALYDVLLLHYEGKNGSTNIIDEAKHTATAQDNAKITTTDQKFGLGSLELDGTLDRVTFADTTDWNIWNSNFTLNTEVKFHAFNNYNSFFAQNDGGTTYWMAFYDNLNNKLDIQADEGGSKGHFTCPWTPSLNTWYHIEFVRSGNTCYIFVNGISQTVTQVNAFATLSDVNAILEIGRSSVLGGGSEINGWLDETRISKGKAQHTASFSAPESAYTSSGVSGIATGATFTITAGTGLQEVLTAAYSTATGIVVIENSIATGSSVYSAGAIDSYWVSKWIDCGSPMVRKNYKDLFLWATKKDIVTMYCETATDEVNTIASAPLVDYAINSLWGTSITNSAWSGEEFTLIKMPVNLSGRYLKIKYSENQIEQSMDLHSFSLVYDTLDIY